MTAKRAPFVISQSDDDWFYAEAYRPPSRSDDAHSHPPSVEKAAPECGGPSPANEEQITNSLQPIKEEPNT